MGIRNILTAPGIHYLLTRFAPTRVRAMAFDEKYRSSCWDVQQDSGGELQDVIRQYLRRGDLLVMGCGGAAVLAGLEADGLESALGIDLSQEAIRLASRYASPKVTFQQADMTTFSPPRRFDVILFSESLYYVSYRERYPLLARLADALKPDGVLVVTLAQPLRYAPILDLVRANFCVLEDRSFTASARHLVVFRADRTRASEPLSDPAPDRNVASAAK